MIGSIVKVASFGALVLGLLAQNEPMLKILVPVGETRAGVRAAGPSWTMALNSRGATDDVEAGEEVVVSEEVGMVVVRVIDSIADTEKDSVVGLIIDDMAEDDGFSCDVETTSDSVVWLDIEGIYEIGSVDSRSVVDVAIDSIIVSDVGTLVGIIIVDDSDSRSVLILELVEPVERDMRIVEPPVVSSGVNAVLTKVDTVAEDVDSPNWGDGKPDVTVVLGTSWKVSRTTLSQ